MTVERKRIRVLLVANAVLLVGATLGIALRGDSTGPERFFRVASGRLEAVTITTEASEIRLFEDGAHWVVERSGAAFPVRDDRVALLREAIDSATISRRVSDSIRDAQAATSQSLELVLSTDTTQETFVLVRSNESVLGRESSSNVTYELSTDLYFYLSQPIEFWVPLRVFPQDVIPSRIISISFTAGSADGDLAAYEFGFQSVDGGSWVTADRLVPVAEQPVFELVSGVTDLIADGLAEPASIRGLEPTGTVRLGLSDGRRFEADVMRLGSQVFALTGPGSDPPRTRDFVQLVRSDRLIELLSRASGL